MNKLLNFLELFKPFVWMVGGFLLATQGIEIINKLDGVEMYIVSIAVLFMLLGIMGKMLEDIG